MSLAGSEGFPVGSCPLLYAADGTPMLPLADTGGMRRPESCESCGRTAGLSGFAFAIGGGWASACRDCAAESDAAWRALTPAQRLSSAE
jgi:hypothetical protein